MPGVFVYFKTVSFVSFPIETDPDREGSSVTINDPSESPWLTVSVIIWSVVVHKLEKP